MDKEKPAETIRVQEAADRSKVHYTAIMQAIAQGKIKAVRADGKVYVIEESLENYKPRSYRRKPQEGEANDG